MKVIPLIAPKINWPDFISTVQEATGKSPMRPLDKVGRNPKDLLALPLIMGLDEAISLESLESGIRLKHLHLSFLLSTMARLRGLTEYTNLDIFNLPADPYENQYLTILTGSLACWREAVYNVLTTKERLDPNLIKAMRMIQESITNAKQIWCGKWRI